MGCAMTVRRCRNQRYLRAPSQAIDLGQLLND
jgi:hypothetical protein